MTIGPVERISGGQFFWVVTISTVAGGIYVWPQVALSAAGGHWMWVLWLGAVTTFAFVRSHLVLAARTDGATYYEHLRSAWGVFAWPWYLGTLAAAVIVDAMVLALYAQMLQTFFYPEAGRWLMDLMLMGVATWFALQSLATLARNVQIWLPATVLLFFVLTAGAVPHAHMLGALRPIWPPAPRPVLDGVLETGFLWSFPDVAVTLAAWVRHSSWARIARLSALSFLLQALVLLVLAALMLASLGPWPSRMLEWPVIYLFVGLGPTSLSFVRPSMLILPIWTAAFVLHVAVRQFSHGMNLQSALGTRSSGRSWIVAALSAAVFGLSLRLPSAPALLDLLGRDVSPAAMIWVAAQLALTLLVVIVRRLPARPMLTQDDPA